MPLYNTINIYIYGKYKITYYDTKLKEIYDMINIISIN